METPAPPPRRPLALLALPAAVLVVAALLARPDGRLHVVFLPVPGDAVLIRAPGGGFTLIDGGRDPALLALYLGRHMPFWQRHLDAVVLTAPDGQRLPGAVAALARYQVGRALAPPGLGEWGPAGEWRRLLGELGARVAVAGPGARLDLGGGASLEVLAAATGEGGGTALLLRYGDFRALIHPGGTALDGAAAGAGPLTALAYPWGRPLDPALAAALRPRAIVYSDGHAGDEPALLSYRERAAGGARVLHEQNDGEIQLISDGRRLQVVTSGP